jgi:hypothetical protein
MDSECNFDHGCVFTELFCGFCPAFPTGPGTGPLLPLGVGPLLFLGTGPLLPPVGGAGGPCLILLRFR